MSKKGVFVRIVIPGIPHIQQIGPGWCGYAAITTVLSFWGYSHSQQNLLAHIKGIREEILMRGVDRHSGERFTVAPYVTMGELALAAMHLTDLKVTLASMDLYKKLSDKNPDFTPYALLKDCLARRWPCIMHHIDHFYVIFGFGEVSNCYFLRDSRPISKLKVIPRWLFDEMWKRPYSDGVELVEGKLQEISSNVDTRYALLVIRPK